MNLEIGPRRTAIVASDAVDVCKKVLEPLIPLALDRIPVATVEAAAEWLLDHEADLAVIDLSLGSEVVELVNEVHRTRPRTPILLLASAAQRQTAARLLGLGAFGYAMKPIYPEEIRAQVERAIEWIRRDPVDRQGNLSPDARDRSA